MPVRRPKLHYQSVGGSLASTRLARPIYYESLLERDFFLTLDLHPAVESFEEQPIRVHWVDPSGMERIYVPDVLVRFRPERRFLGRPTKAPVIFELKFRDDLGKHWDSLKPKLRAGLHLAKQRGCNFKILTEQQIRGIALQNAEFIRKHLHGQLDQDAASAIMRLVRMKSEVSAEELATSASRTGRATQEVLDYVWALVARGRLSVDLEFPISPCSLVTMGWNDAEP